MPIAFTYSEEFSLILKSKPTLANAICEILWLLLCSISLIPYPTTPIPYPASSNRPLLPSGILVSMLAPYIIAVRLNPEVYESISARMLKNIGKSAFPKLCPDFIEPSMKKAESCLTSLIL